MLNKHRYLILAKLYTSLVFNSIENLRIVFAWRSFELLVRIRKNTRLHSTNGSRRTNNIMNTII